MRSRRAPRSIRGGLPGLISLVVLVVVLLGSVLIEADLGLGAGTPSSTDRVSPSSPAPEGSAREVLDTLTVSDPPSVEGYDADLFGWRQDTDHNGCDTRNDVLRRDLSDTQTKPGTKGCVVASGTLVSPYSGETLHFTPGGNTNVQIDHVVARENAWQSGASTWSEERLKEFGNDPLNLLAVESDLNREKSNSAADEWLPEHEPCDYAGLQVAVKVKYDLTVTSAEHDALAGTLDACGGGTLPNAELWPEPQG